VGRVRVRNTGGASAGAVAADCMVGLGDGGRGFRRLRARRRWRERACGGPAAVVFCFFSPFVWV
jgi:hypothetical protein